MAQEIIVELEYADPCCMNDSSFAWLFFTDLHDTKNDSFTQSWSLMAVAARGGGDVISRASRIARFPQGQWGVTCDLNYW